MKSEYDIIVVGAGPAGSITARTAAEHGVSVLMLEKDRDVGYPVRCAEAIRKSAVDEFIGADPKFIATEINTFCMIAPDGTEVIIPLDETGYVLERRIFDYELAKSAANAGTEILTRAYVNGLLFDNNKVSGVKYEFRGEPHKVKAKIVVGADGVESRVGRWAGLKTYTDFRDMECAVQVTASGVSVNKNTAYLFYGGNYAPKGYFWIFPKGENIANIGLGVSGNVGKTRSALSYLTEFMEKRFPGASILTQIAGGVPCSRTLDKITAPGLMLVGDAARQVNPISGGGIASGMVAGKIAGEIAAKAIKTNNYELIFEYDRTWHKPFGKRHEILEKVKKTIYDFSDEKLNKIAHSFVRIPTNKRSLGNLAKMALINTPSLALDAAKIFFMKSK